MSLVGNLEDLGLGEILQIVSLSRKSGVLSLYSKGREGKIVFRQGVVIRASIDGRVRHLGELLLRKQVIDKATLRKAISIQERDGFRERLGDIVIQHFSVNADTVAEVIRRQIEEVVYTLFSWDEGSFDFELQDNVEALDGPEQDLYLAQGLNPQFLAMEGTRLLDERRHHETPDDWTPRGEDTCSVMDNCDLAFDLMQGTQPEEKVSALQPAEGMLAVLVDDDSDTRSTLAALLSGWGYTVHDFSKTEETLIKIDFLYRDGFRPTVFVDLIMPRMDGSGILGGLELIELLHDNFPDLPLIVLSDHYSSNAEQKVKEKGYPLVIKPRKSEISDAETFQVFSDRLRVELARFERKSKAAAGTETINLADELRMEIGDDFIPATSSAGHGPGFSLLRSMLEELNSLPPGGGIILLVLRFAAEFMNRAVVFVVRDSGIMGLGQFGIVDTAELADTRVRDLCIPLDADPLFTRVLAEKIAVKAPPDGTKWNRHLLEQLGGGSPVHMFIGPIISEDKVVALLYGDNLPERRPIGDTDSLEIFLSQAGMAMEKALLQQRLKEKAQEGA
jgi:CheY-like chemotaxis protein